jgi:hypothetical protein
MAILRRHANSFGWLKSPSHPFAQLLRIAALLENGQQADGSIQLPAALVPWCPTLAAIGSPRA